MIRAEHLYKHFDAQSALEDVSVAFEKGRCNLVIGASGSGKTVLLKSIVGLHKIDSGKVWYDDREFTSMGPKEKKKLRQEMGMLFQGGALFDSMNIEENVMFQMNMFTSLTRKEKLNRVNFCLERVGLEKVNHMLPAELSGGMRKRAAIARAISMSPEYLFCDEPNSGLDPRTGILIDGLIKEITEEFNMTTIVNTHDMNSVLEIGDSVVFIHQGKVRWEGNRDEILHTDNQLLNDFVFATRIAQKLKPSIG